MVWAWRLDYDCMRYGVTVRIMASYKARQLEHIIFAQQLFEQGVPQDSSKVQAEPLA